MIRYLIPRLTWDRWDGDTDDGDGKCRGRHFSFEWLGLMVEIAGSVVRRRPLPPQPHDPLYYLGCGAILLVAIAAAVTAVGGLALWALLS